MVYFDFFPSLTSTMDVMISLFDPRAFYALRYWKNAILCICYLYQIPASAVKMYFFKSGMEIGTKHSAFRRPAKGGNKWIESRLFAVLGAISVFFPRHSHNYKEYGIPLHHRQNDVPSTTTVTARPGGTQQMQENNLSKEILITFGHMQAHNKVLYARKLECCARDGME